MDETCGRITQSMVDGMQAYRLTDRHTSLSVVPAHGARLLSLRHVPTDREWLWAAEPRRPLAAVPPYTAFEEGPLAGMDECLPTVAPCEHGGRSHADHGEAWSRAWTLHTSDLDQGAITTSVELPAQSLRFTRRISLVPGAVMFDYTLENSGVQHAHALWAMHPLFRIEPGALLQMPGTIGPMRIASMLGMAGIEAGQTLSWPGTEAGFDLSELEIQGDGPGYLKLFARHQLGAAYTLRDPTGVGLSITFGPSDSHPAIGIWLTRGGWHGHHHLALEPTNALADRLDQAIAQPDSAVLLAPHETRRWWVQWAWAYCFIATVLFV